MKLPSLVRYALSDLRHRPVATSLNVAAVALAAGYILVLGFYGASIHRYQGELLERALPTKVVAAMPDVTDSRLRLTSERIAELGRMEGVQLAYPRVELNVRVSVDGSRAVDLPAEGTLPGDPSLAGERMLWGGGVSDSEAREVVLAKALLGKLGGYLSEAAGPTPAELTLEVSRSIAGRAEVQRHQLAVVGVLKHQDTDRIYLPVELLTTLDLWCTHKIDALGGARSFSGARRLRAPHGYAYVPAGSADAVEAEAAALQVTAEPAGELTVLDANGTVWAAVERPDGEPLSEEDLARVAAATGRARLHPVQLAEYAGHSTAALSSIDPRWRACPPEHGPDSGALLAAGSDVPPEVHGRVAAVAPAPAAAAGFAVDAELTGSAETLRRLFFEPRESDGVQPFCLVETDDPAAIAALAGLRGAAPRHGEELGWSFFRDPGEPFAWQDAAALVEALAASGGLAAGTWSEGAVTGRAQSEGPEGTVAREGRWPLRRVPAAFYRRLLGPPAAGLSEAELAAGCVFVTALGAHAPRALRLGGVRVPVARVIEIEGAADSLWMPRLPGAGTEAAEPPAGVLAWGSWGAVARLAAAPEIPWWSPEPGASRRPRFAAALLRGRSAEVLERLGQAGAAALVTELPAVRVRAQGGGQRSLVLVSEREAFGVAPDVMHQRGDGSAGVLSATLALEDWSSPELRVILRESFPPSLAVVPEGIFRAAAYAASTHSTPLPGSVRHDLAFEDPVDFVSARRELEAAGLTLRPLTPLRERALLRYRVADETSDDGLVGSDLVRVLSMSPPTFAGARLVKSLEGELEGAAEPLPVAASPPADPERFAHPPLAGHWLRPTADRGEGQVVLPAAVLARQPAGGAQADPADPGDPGDPPDSADPATPPAADTFADVLGRSVFVRFSRQRPTGGEDSLAIPLEVVGVSEAPEAYVPLELLAKVEAWREGALLFNESHGTFESPAEVTLRNGWVRCNLFAADVASVPPLVASLQAMGYRTEDRLADQEGLRRLGRILVFIVGFFVLGCVVNASITVLVATMMNVKSKIFEIGILRAHGVRVREVVGIFASQGLTIGLLAFLVAAAAVFALEPPLRTPVRQAFAVEPGTVLVGSPFDGGLWWLSTAALLVAIVFSFCGVVLPAAFACRLSPVEALRRRE